jgi:asparagine synthase (glutamine-hydrolysing)
MCGIVGVLSAAPIADGRRIVESMNAQIVHRGPDDAGLWLSERAAVGMRRLSIIDVAGGHQPMMTDDGVVIVFNGEIYNYKALRARLEKAGYSFKTHSDTEVILNLYHHGGLTALDDLEGMFGIGLVDQRTEQAHLIRDRLGIKPLYFGEFDGRLYFASEIKAILAGSARRPPVDLQSIYDFLYLRYVPAPGTIWRGIAKLQPGHRLSFDLKRGTWTAERYWKPNFRAAIAEPGRDYEGEFRDVFLRAVESHLLTADVPVGTLLSGGLDSSAVSAAIAELGIRGLHSFTVAFNDGGDFSELSYARQAAHHVGAECHEVLIGKREFIDFLPQFVEFSDEPIADLASVPLYYVSQLARKYVKVVLSGEGADEVLAGYNFEQMIGKLDARGRLLRAVPRWMFRSAARFAGDRRAAVLRAMSEDGWSATVKANLTSATRIWSDADLARLWRGNGRLRPTERVIRQWYDDCDSREPIDLMQHAWCQDWLVEDLLMKADKMTMANSIELRVPFLTHSLVEWAQTLPAAWRVGDRRVGYVSKRILRSFAASRLPAEIISRPKRGFPVPAYVWLQHDDVGTWARDRLAARDSPIYEWLDQSVALDETHRARRGDLAAAERVWSLLVLDFWSRRWLN